MAASRVIIPIALGDRDPPSPVLFNRTCLYRLDCILKCFREAAFLFDMDYAGFGSKLHHEVPSWVESGARFHIRIRCHQDSPAPLTSPGIAHGILKSGVFYENKLIWHVVLLLLMPDHLHAILSFAPDRTMSHVVGDWKRYTSKSFGVSWQENYFDHRLRNEEQFSLKYHYILQNPVAAGLCKDPLEWPWWISENRRPLAG